MHACFEKQFTHMLSNSDTMGCPPVRDDNPRALASGLPYVQVDRHGITIFNHLHQCRCFEKQFTHMLSNSDTMGCPPVRGDNPRALASGLSYVQVDKHGITIFNHLHLCSPCTS